jgi:uncharacterized membrane protein YuzA (DUF378 family)
MKALHGVAFVLVIIGGLNWLLVGIGVGDVVAYLGGALSTVVYVLVGLSAVLLALTHKSTCKKCETSAPSAPQM